MVAWTTGWLSTHGYFAVFVLMVAENVFPPLPSELIIPLIGYLVAEGQMSTAGALSAAIAGSVVGALPWYFGARWIGRRRVLVLMLRAGPWLGVTRGDLGRAQRWFARSGWQAVTLGRIVPGLRTLISVPAGLFRMSLPLFLACTVIGSLAWSAALMSAGFVLAANHALVANLLDPIAGALLGAMLLAYAVRVRSLLKKKSP